MNAFMDTPCHRPAIACFYSLRAAPGRLEDVRASDEMSTAATTVCMKMSVTLVAVLAALATNTGPAKESSSAANPITIHAVRARGVNRSSMVSNPQPTRDATKLLTNTEP